MRPIGAPRTAMAGLLAASLFSACYKPTGNAPPAPRFNAQTAGLPVYGIVPAIDLIDQDGKPFTVDRMKGRVWIANFIFTSCPMACPLLSQRMAFVQSSLRGASPNIQLASFSIDPTHDTPPTMRQYGTRYHQDPARWTFVTGKTESLISVVSNGFTTSTPNDQHPDPREAKGSFEVLHGERFVLFDQAGRIRGYYHKDDVDVHRLLDDAHHLAEEHT